MGHAYTYDFKDQIPMAGAWYPTEPDGTAATGHLHSIVDQLILGGYHSPNPVSYSTPLFTCTELGGATTLFNGTYRHDSKGYFTDADLLLRNTQENYELSHYSWTLLGGRQRSYTAATFNTYDAAFTVAYPKRNLFNGPYSLTEIKNPGGTVFCAEADLNTSNAGQSVECYDLDTNSGGVVTSNVFQYLRHGEGKSGGTGIQPVGYGDGHAILLNRQILTTELDVN